MTTPIVAQWDGEHLVPLRRFHNQVNAELIVGEHYRVEFVEERSQRSHRHYFAALHEAWMNLPDAIATEYATVEHLRKRALIATGHYDERRFIASSPVEARKLAAFLRPADGFAVISVAGSAVVERKAKSQSRKAMGGPTFQKSKVDVLEWCDALIGVEAGELEKAAEAA